MHVLRTLRALCGLLIGACMMGASGLIILALALGELLLVRPFRRGRPSLLRGAPNIVGRIISLVAYRGIMGNHIVRSGRLPYFEKDDQIVVISPHPPDLEVPIHLGEIGHMLGKPCVWVGKRELLTTFPMCLLIGWPLRLIDGGIFIDRNDRASAIDAIRQLLPDVFMSGAATGIFPDLGRPNARRIENDRRKFSDIEGITDFQHSLVPREGGIGEIVDGTNGTLYVINVTCGFDRPSMRLRDVLNLVRATYRFEYELITIPRDRDARRRALIELWRDKNRRITAWRTHT